MSGLLSNFIKRWQRESRPAATAVSEAQWQQAEAALPFLAFLKPGERAHLRTLACGFLEQKEFYGAQGLTLTDDMLLIIALQACLPIFAHGLKYYRNWVGVIVYPGAFVSRQRKVDAIGLVHEFDSERLGEAWEKGPVVISWQTERGHGFNVTVHEFAHKLDMANHRADGYPPLHADMTAKDWHAAFSSAYQQLCHDVRIGRETALDPYATENPAEFFAVASEAFFETPSLLQHAYPEVYTQLQLLYRLNPAEGERRYLPFTDFPHYV